VVCERLFEQVVSRELERGDESFLFQLLDLGRLKTLGDVPLVLPRHPVVHLYENFDVLVVHLVNLILSSARWGFSPLRL